MAPKRNRRTSRWYRFLPHSLRVWFVLFSNNWLLSLFNIPAFFGLYLLSLLLYRRQMRCAFQGVNIIRPHTKDKDLFIECTKDALSLIEKYDPRRFQNIQREILYIDKTTKDYSGSYQRAMRVCLINFARFRHDLFTPEHRGTSSHLWYTALYASTLVHEATHGRVYSHGIPYSRKTRLRIERLCRREQQRFAEHLPQDTYDFAKELVKPMSEELEEWYEAYWNRSFFERCKSTMQEIRVMLREK